MKKTTLLLTILAAFAWTSTSYGMGIIARDLVYKGTITAPKMVFNVDDANNFAPLSIQGYWVVSVIYSGSYGEVIESNAVFYDKKREWIKMIPDSITIDPCDPCQIEILHFTASDADGYLSFDVAGKGKLTKDSNDPNNPKTYVPTSMKGTGFISNFDFFAPDQMYTGPILVTLTLDPKLTYEANSKGYGVTDTLNNIIDKLTTKGTWHIWPYVPAGP